MEKRANLYYLSLLYFFPCWLYLLWKNLFEHRNILMFILLSYVFICIKLREPTWSISTNNWCTAHVYIVANRGINAFEKPVLYEEFFNRRPFLSLFISVSLGFSFSIVVIWLIRKKMRDDNTIFSLVAIWRKLFRISSLLLFSFSLIDYFRVKKNYRTDMHHHPHRKWRRSSNHFLARHHSVYNSASFQNWFANFYIVIPSWLPRKN
jgi:hypothetical protein